jgi:hypothetical protein
MKMVQRGIAQTTEVFCNAEQSSYRNGGKKGYLLPERQRKNWSTFDPQLSKLRSKLASVRFFYYSKLGPCHTQAISMKLKEGWEHRSLLPQKMRH